VLLETPGLGELYPVGLVLHKVGWQKTTNSCVPAEKGSGRPFASTSQGAVRFAPVQQCPSAACGWLHDLQRRSNPQPNSTVESARTTTCCFSSSVCLALSASKAAPNTSSIHKRAGDIPDCAALNRSLAAQDQAGPSFATASD
jgi:hypothetical protein